MMKKIMQAAYQKIEVASGNRLHQTLWLTGQSQTENAKQRELTGRDICTRGQLEVIVSDGITNICQLQGTTGHQLKSRAPEREMRRLKSSNCQNQQIQYFKIISKLNSLIIQKQYQQAYLQHHVSNDVCVILNAGEKNRKKYEYTERLQIKNDYIINNCRNCKTFRYIYLNTIG